jgi:hypothetical protein
MFGSRMLTPETPTGRRVIECAFAQKGTYKNKSTHVKIVNARRAHIHQY